MKPKKYICPICKRETSNVRYTEDAVCKGVTVKCNKCGNIIEVKLEKKSTNV